MFGIGNVFATTFRTWLRNLPRFLLVSLVFHVPIFAWNVALYFESSRDFLNEVFYLKLFELHPVLRVSGQWIIESLVTAAIAIYVVARMRGEQPGIGTSIATALRRSLRVLGGGLVAYLGTTGVMTAVAVVLWDRNDFFYRSEVSYWAWSIAWVVLISLWVAIVPMLAVEKRGVFSAVGRNFALGHRVKVFALVLVQQVVIVGTYWLLAFFLLWEYATFENYESRRRIYDFATMGVEVLYTTLIATLAAVTYERLRSAKDGPTEGELNRVFE